MEMKRTHKLSIGLGVLVATLSAASLNATANAAEATKGIQPTQEFKIAHCCHAHPYSPYDDYCCHEPSSTVYVVPAYRASRVYVAPVYGVGPASVRGVSRRTSRRVSRRR